MTSKENIIKPMPGIPQSTKFRNWIMKTVGLEFGVKF